MSTSQEQLDHKITPPTHAGFVELAYRTPTGAFHRNVFLASNDQTRFTTGFEEHRKAGDEVFRSIARYPTPERCPDHRWPGMVTDIDHADDLVAAQHGALGVVHHLAKALGIEPAMACVAFSGAKGLHIYFPGALFGPQGNRQTANFWKRMALELHDLYPMVDLSIYRESALLRLCGSVHHKTGLYKVPLEYAELRDLSMDDIQSLAKSPREEDVWVDAETTPKAQRWLEDAVEKFNKQHEQNSQRVSVNSFKLRSGWATPLCVRRIEEGAELVDGERHDVLFALAIWYRNTGMCQQEAIDRLSTIDTQHPIHDPDFIPRAVASAFHGKGFRGCPHAGLERFCNGEQGQCVLQHEQAG